MRCRWWSSVCIRGTQLSDLECYTQNRTKMLHDTSGLSSCLVNTTTYTSQQVLCIEYEQHAYLLTIILMILAHKEQQFLTDALCLVCEDVPQLR